MTALEISYNQVIYVKTAQARRDMDGQFIKTTFRMCVSIKIF